MSFGHFNQVNSFEGIGELVPDDIFHKGGDFLIEGFEFEVSVFPAFVLFVGVEIDAWKLVAELREQLPVPELGCLMDFNVEDFGEP